MKDVVVALQQGIGYTFIDKKLCIQALTHRSYGAQHNERLEFLGDAILDFLVAEIIYHAHPKATEGELSTMRAQAVCGEQLATIGRTLNLGDLLFLGMGEARAGGHRRDSIIANAVEAVIAAVYLDGGWDHCRIVVQTLFTSIVEKLMPDNSKDAKTMLQEYLQSRHLSLPVYELIKRSGSDHNASFVMACRVAALSVCAEGEASSRKKAEQIAAKKILEKLGL